MKQQGLYRLLMAIAAITVLSGLGQLLLPGVVLGIVGSEATAVAKHFFAIIGMFMVLFGGLLLHALLDSGDHPVAVFWTGMQKFGAAFAVALGVLKAIFGPLALLVAGFDLASGLLILWYWTRLRNRTSVKA